MARKVLDQVTRKALENQLAAAHDAKGFLGSAILNQVINEMATEAYQNFLSLEQPGQLMAVTMRAQIIEDLYQRIVKAAQAGDTAQDVLARAAEE